MIRDAVDSYVDPGDDARQRAVRAILAMNAPVDDWEGSLASSTLDIFAPVLPIPHALMRRVPDLAARSPSLAARDLIHVATCIHEGITEILSTDPGFDAVQEVHRIPPAAFAA